MNAGDVGVRAVCHDLGGVEPPGPVVGGQVLAVPTAGGPVPRLVGVVGAARAGKDTVAAALGLLGYRRVAFADALKTVALHALDGLDEGLALAVRLKGWEYAKENLPGARTFLQALGVAVRDNVSPTAWVDAAFRDDDGVTPVVVTDVRFLNEVAAIRGRGGVVLRVDRPGVGPVNGHVSEHEWRQVVPDAVVVNDGTVADLGVRVRAVVHGLADSLPAYDESPPDWWDGQLTCPRCLTGPLLEARCSRCP